MLSGGARLKHGMMDREWQAILHRHGTEVTVFARRESEGEKGWALLQPLLEKNTQLLPTPLGGRREDRFLYLGESGLALEAGKGGRVECELGTFSIQSAHPIHARGAVSHWWAVLRPQDRKEECT